MWGFFGGQQKSASKEIDVANEESPLRTGVVDMTSLDITYITHRLVGECCLNKALKYTRRLHGTVLFFGCVSWQATLSGDSLLC